MEYSLKDIERMHACLLEAQQAQAIDEVPIGAQVYIGDQLIGSGYNQNISQCDPTAHAEIHALRTASQHMQNHRLIGADLYSTIEPCLMCTGAAIHARVQRIIFGAYEPKAGALGSALNVLRLHPFNHSIKVVGPILQEDCQTMIRQFFKQKRMVQ